MSLEDLRQVAYFTFLFKCVHDINGLSLENFGLALSDNNLHSDKLRINLLHQVVSKPVLSSSSELDESDINYQPALVRDESDINYQPALVLDESDINYQQDESDINYQQDESDINYQLDESDINYQPALVPDESDINYQPALISSRRE